jgi:hypothetical protein
MASPKPPPADLDGIRRSIRELIDLWPEMVGTSEWPFSRDLDLRRAVALHAHAHHAIQLARGLVAMDRAGAEIAMIPTVRAIFEMGVVSAWLLLTLGSGDSLVRDGTRKRKAAQEDLLRLGVDADPGLAQSLAVLAELDAEPISFDRQCRALADGDTLYVTYRGLSAETHAGLGIADAYFVDADDSPIGVKFRPMAVLDPRDAYLGIAACLLFVAVNADATGRATVRHSKKLRKIARRLGIGTDFRRADGTKMEPRPSP